MKIEIISGSPRKESVTVRLAIYLQHLLAQQEDMEVGLVDMRHYHMPPMEQTFDNPESAPKSHRDVVKRIFEADGFIIVTPEYNGNYTPALQNLFDHFPKQQHKAFGIVTASPGALGGIRAALHLQHLVLALFGVPSPYMLVTPQVDKKFDTMGKLIDNGFQKSIDTFIKEYLWLAQKLAG